MTIDIRSAPYNAACNGEQDDTAAWAQAIVDATASGDEIFFHGQSVATINYAGQAPLSIRGSGPLTATIAPQGPATAISAATAAALNLSNFGISYVAPGATAISIDGPTPKSVNNETAVDNVRIIGAMHGIHLLRAAWYRMNRVTVNQFNGNALWIEDLANADAGDGEIRDFLGIASGAAGTHIFQTSGGGLKVDGWNCKYGLTAYQSALLNGASTCDLWLHDGSLESQSLASIYMQPQGPAAFRHVMISDIEMQMAPTAFTILDAPGAAPQWAENLTVRGCSVLLPSIAGVKIGFNIAGVKNFSLQGNIVEPFPGYEANSYGYIFGPTATNGKYDSVPTGLQYPVINSSSSVTPYP
jgi:hypothetical protein